MQQGWTMRKSVLIAVAGFGLVTATTGCATKKYVRTTVDTRAQELSARIDNQQGEIKSAQGSIEELNGVAREHGQKIATLDTATQQNEQKALKALQTGEAAQTAANKVGTQVASLDTQVVTLDTKFQNRNRFVTLYEDQVSFAFNSDKLNDTSKEALNKIAQHLNDNPDAILVMEGRTDSSGSTDYNIQLGKRRAEAVIRYMAVEQGVPFHRISQLSFGEEKPLADNKTREGRSQNRAVVVRVMGPGEASGQEMVSQSRTNADSNKEE